MKAFIASVVGTLLAGVNSAAAQTTSAQMFQTFKDWCLADAPSYEAIAAKAATEKLKTPQKQIQTVSGGTQETQHWIVDGNTSYGVSAIRAIRQNSKTEGCVVYFPAAAINDTVAYLSATSRFGQPQSLSSDSQNATWSGPFPNSEIRFTSRMMGTLGEGGLSISQTEPSK